MDKELKKAILENRKAEHEQKIQAIHTKIEARRAEREQRIAEIHEAVQARKEARLQRRAESMKAACHQQEAVVTVAERENVDRRERWNAMMANVPTIQFPEDDPKYNSARKYSHV
ncbi:MAG: hypothetical protein IJG94_00940 [Clostridia bacterium]|nr:hypothetical protein [Clostridia bacterium]